MSRPSLRRSLVGRAATTLVAALVASVVVPLGGTAQAARPFPAQIDLPAGFAPEGIAAGPGRTAYLGQRDTGEILRLDLRTGEGEVVSQGTGDPALGVKLGSPRRLWVAGGDAGSGYVVDTRTGDVLASYDLAGSSSSFVNDVVLTRRAAWFTDSLQAQVYRVPLGRRLATQDDVDVLPLSGEWTQVAGGLNANGIAPTPDREALLVVNLTTGDLARVDPVTGDARVVDLGGYSLTNGDGLLLRGRTLYAVRNRDNQVAVLRLSADGSTGALRRVITADGFDVPTTVARSGKRLYLPNARFTSPGATQFSVTGVPRRG